MKVAITATEPKMDAALDLRFGRAKWFVVVDTETGDWSAHDNAQNFNAPSGAGIQAGRNVIELGVEAVITGRVGPKAFATLNAGGIAAYVGAGGSVAEAVEALGAGKLERADAANAESHWM